MIEFFQCILGMIFLFLFAFLVGAILDFWVHFEQRKMEHWPHLPIEQMKDDHFRKAPGALIEALRKERCDE